MKHTAIRLITAGLIVGTASLVALAQTPPASPTPSAQVTSANFDGLFLMTASSSNLFEIETSRLAQSKGSNAQIKQFAQTMITDHTKAQTQVTQLMSRLSGSSGTGNASGTGSSTGSGSGSSGSGSSTGSGSNSGSGSGSSGSGSTGSGSGNGSGSSGSTGSGSSSSGTASGAQQGGTPAAGNANPPAASSGTTTNPSTGAMTPGGELTPMQQIKIAYMNTLSGAQFDRVYATEQIDAHESAITVFRFASQQARDQNVKAFATQTLPTLQKHLSEITAIEKNLAK